MPSWRRRTTRTSAYVTPDGTRPSTRSAMRFISGVEPNIVHLERVEPIWRHVQVVHFGGGGLETDLRHYANKRDEVHDPRLDFLVRGLAFGTADGLLRALVEQRIQRGIAHIRVVRARLVRGVIGHADDPIGIDRSARCRAQVVAVRSHEVEIRTALHLLHLQVDADGAQLRLHGFGELGPWTAKRGQQSREPLPSPCPNPVRASNPPRTLEDLLGFGRVVAEALFDIRRARPHAFRQWPDTDLVDTKEDLVDDRLTIHRPADRLAHGQVVRWWLADIEVKAKRVAAPRRLNKHEAFVGLQPRVVGLGQLVDQQALARFQGGDAGRAIDDRAELQRLEIGRLAILEHFCPPRVVWICLQGDDAVRGPCGELEWTRANWRHGFVTGLERVEVLRRQDAEVLAPDLEQERRVRLAPGCPRR